MAGKNQGEGDQESARKYEKDTEEFIESGRVDDAAHKAEEDPKAEKAGRERAKEFDPEEKQRDYSKPQ